MILPLRYSSEQIRLTKEKSELSYLLHAKHSTPVIDGAVVGATHIRELANASLGHSYGHVAMTPDRIRDHQELELLRERRWRLCREVPRPQEGGLPGESLL